MGPSVSLFFFPAVVIIAMYGGYGPSMFATVLSAASLAFFIVAPRYSFEIGADDRCGSRCSPPSRSRARG